MKRKQQSTQTAAVGLGMAMAMVTAMAMAMAMAMQWQWRNGCHIMALIHSTEWRERFVIAQPAKAYLTRSLLP